MPTMGIKKMKVFSIKKFKCFCLFLLLTLLSCSFIVLAKDDSSQIKVVSKSPVSDKLAGEKAIDKTVQKTVVYKSKYFWVIYDNVCPYCRSSKKHIKELDWEGKFKFLSYRDPKTYKMFPELTREECEKDVHMVTPDGEVLIGYDVFRSIIDNLVATKLLNPLLHNDFAQQKLNEIYEKMVKERSCYYNKTDACDIKAVHKKIEARQQEVHKD